MFIINLLKSWIKKNQYFKKSGPQSSLSGFLEKSKSRNFPKVSSLSLFLFALFFFVGNFKTAHAAWWSSSKDLEEEKTYPGKPPTDFVKKFSDYLDNHTDENKTIAKASKDLKKQLHEGEKRKKPHVSEVDSHLIRERVAETIRKGLFSIEEKKDPYIKDFAVFRALSKQSFETNLRLVSTAQEPLFLDNKEAFSFEIRPFVSHMMTEDHLLQLGSIFTARKHWGNKYVSMQGLYGFDAEMFDRVSHDALLDVTYGQFFNDFLSGSLTLSSGFAYSDVRRVESRNYYSHPKSFSLGLSPLLVYYLPTKIPLDLFLGGDVYYSYRFAFEEHSRGDKCIYGAENEVLYRVKTGPSYTMKRRGKTRLYQLRFHAAFNVQSQIPDRFTLTPNVLFESQGHEVRGGYLFNLGFDLGMLKKSWSLSYGLRF